MTRKHFELIANTLADVRHYNAFTPSKLDNDTIHEAYVEAFAEALAKTNPRFDRDRFLEAAGIER